MTLEEAERSAALLLWRERGTGDGEPTAEEFELLLAEIRSNRAHIEQESLNWANRKLAKPPRSGLWSNLYPKGIGWLFLMILATVAVIAIVLLWPVR